MEGRRGVPGVRIAGRAGLWFRSALRYAALDGVQAWVRGPFRAWLHLWGWTPISTREFLVWGCAYLAAFSIVGRITGLGIHNLSPVQLAAFAVVAGPGTLVVREIWIRSRQ